MNTKLHIKYGFKLDGVYFGYHEGILYQLPYNHEGRYYGLRLIRRKTLKTSGWAYYRIRRLKYGIHKLSAMLEPVNWEVSVPVKI
jgi:hypothetical protein